MPKAPNAGAKPLESEVQRAICDYLQMRGIFFWRNNNVPVYAKSNDGQNRFRAMPKYSRKGVPDIIALIDGDFVGIEVKRDALTNLTEDQKKFREDVLANGCVYLVTWSVDDLKMKLSSLSYNVL